MAEFSESDASTFGTGSELEPENDVMAPLSTSTPIIKHQDLLRLELIVIFLMTY